MSFEISITALRSIPIVAAGDSLDLLIGDALSRELELNDGDVVVVSQKIISKAEGRTVSLSSISPDDRSRELARKTGKDAKIVQLIIGESSEILRATGNVIISIHRTGHTMANAGVDASNVAGDDDTVLLWPENPDRSAERIRLSLEKRFGVRLAVIVNDSFGRPWRVGVTGAAIGVSGMSAVLDQRGEADMFGRALRVTISAVADQIATAALLVLGEAGEGTPVAIVRGARFSPDDGRGGLSLLRPASEDLFR